MADKHGAGMGIKKTFTKLANKYMNKGSVRRSKQGSPNLADASKAITQRRRAQKKALKETD